jgi:hypothetical protein
VFRSSRIFLLCIFLPGAAGLVLECIKMSNDPDGGSDSSVRRRSGKTSAPAPEEDPCSIDPMALKPLSYALPLPLPLLLLPLFLLLLCALAVMLPPSVIMSASLAVQSLRTKAGSRQTQDMLRVHAEASTK